MYFRGKKVLVTGGSGLIGSALVRRLLEGGAEVRATYHRRPPAVGDDRAGYLQSDLTREEDCRRAVAGVDLVFHLAAYSTGAAEVVARPLVHVTPNVIMNARMLEAAYEAGISKFLWLSSSTVYPPSVEPMREEDGFTGEPGGKSFFAGWMKRTGEKLCQMYGEKSTKPMTTIVLRPSNVYGPGDDFEFATSHVIPALIRKSVERWDPLEVWGTGDEVRDMLYVDDMVEVMLRAMEHVSGYDVFNVGIGKGYRIKEILAMILERDGYTNARVVFDPSKPTTFPIRLLDVSKADRVLGFRPAIDLGDGLSRTIAWYRQSRPDLSAINAF